MADKSSSSFKSQQRTISSMSILEKLDVIPALFTVLIKTLTAFITTPFTSSKHRPKSLFRYVILTAMRTFTARTNVRQQHFVSPPTDTVYIDFCKKFNLVPRSEVLEDGTKAHWIGEEGSENVILNFHGGGYTLPPTPGMFEFIHQIITLLSSQGKSVSCLFLSYDLAPTSPYPRQLQQAASLLNHVLHKLNYSPSSILLSGDSAGANLAVALLSHIAHPHPSRMVEIPRIELKGGDGKGGKLKGLLLTSPWVSFDITAKSFRENEWKDVVSIPAGISWSTAFLSCPWPHTPAIDPYNQPSSSLVSASWFAPFASIVEDVLVVCGGDEVLVDGITEFVGKLREGMGEERVRFVVGEGEYHDMPSLDLQLGYKEDGVQAKEIKRWIVGKF